MTKWILFLLSGFTLAAQSVPNVAKDVMAASDAWRHAMMTKDAAGLEKILHPDFTFVHSAGQSQTKAEAIQSYAKGKAIIEAIDFSETTVNVYGTTALVRAIVDWRNNTEGKIATYHMRVLHVWLKGPGGWQLIARQPTLLPPPAKP